MILYFYVDIMQKAIKVLSLVVFVGMEILTPIGYAIEGVEDVSKGNPEIQLEKTVTELEEKSVIEVEGKGEEVKEKVEKVEENAEVTNVESEVIKEPEEKIEEPLPIKEEQAYYINIMKIKKWMLLPY